MVDIEYLKRLAETLQKGDPYSNVYTGFVRTLHYIEQRIERLGERIRKEVAKLVK